ncbi:hypothetical protein GCG21_11720 [Pseudactinotalea sp. HY160]|uniref:hypothetical protein n=1 Tax=Pseudactinotalea sp. HY160 TaxID=2654490 RepID=UPI00128CFDD2|nr:hypothetical protein [Pseudactinotalea sp. HY160]MPV50660.1 hypothetical protein [Pseudactinotalea sp. HY160]
MAAIPAFAALLIGGALVAPAEAASPPGCVNASTASSGLKRTLKVYNGCISSYRIKTIWDYDLDGPCATLASKPTRTEVYFWPARFDGLQSC